MNTININKKTIFYFSGTGNCLQVSKDIAEKLEDVELISIPRVMENEEIQIQCESIGIVFPVYMWGLPLIVENFMKKLNINKTTYVFSVATFGAFPGCALNQVNDLLKNKNAQLNAGFPIKMPGNYIVLYGANSNKKQIKAFEREKVKTKKIAKIINERENYGHEKSKVLFDRIFAPITHKRIYKINAKDKLFYVKDNCTGCGVCQKVCSVKNIELRGKKPAWNNRCEQCMACIQYCPKEAIEYGKKSIGRKRYRNPNIKLDEMIYKNESL